MARASNAGTVLMFSGGRDSTVAALRLAARGTPLCLVTVSSNHLVGMTNVEKRLAELEQYLPRDSEWLKIRQPQSGATFGAAFSQTCLPCQHDYALAGAVVAKQRSATRLALGYASYQGHWPEQTPGAIKALGAVLGAHGIELELPAHGLQSKEQAQQELADRGLSIIALEQKCLKQVSNISIYGDELSEHIVHWASELDLSLRSVESINVEILGGARVGCLAPAA